MDYLNPYFLRTFIEAYEVLNFTRTSKNLGVTQSGVSQHIQSLEEMLEVSLFDRVGKKVIPTPSARKLYEYSKDNLSHMDEFISQMRYGDDSLAGEVKLGVPGSFGVFFLPKLVQWQKKNPKLKFLIEYGPNHRIFNMLKTGELDIGVTSEPAELSQFVSEKFYEQEFVLVGAPKIKVNGCKIDELINAPFIDYVGSKPIFHEWLASNFKNFSNNLNQFNVRASINNMEGISYLLEKSVGVTIFPRQPLEPSIAKGKLTVHKSKKRVFNSLYIVYRRERFTRRVSHLKKLILESVK